MTSQQSEYVQLEVPEGIYDLNVGQPSPQLLPRSLLQSADSLPISDPTFLQYSSQQGYSSFRKTLASFLTSETGGNTSADELMITSGNSSAIQLIATRIAADHSGRPLALVEAPTYQFAVDILAGCGFEIRSIAVDQHGLVVDEIERLLVEEAVRPALVFTIPSHQNPTGVNLHPQRRSRLIQLADDHGFYILADEAYQLLNFPDTPANVALACEDTTTNGVVFTIGTYSKIFAPAIRLGWVQTKPKLAQWLSQHPVLVSGGSMNPVMAGWMEPLMANRQLSHFLNHLRQEYWLRYQHLLQGINRHLPDLQVVSEPDGGYFLWCRLPDSLDSDALHELAKEKYRVSFRPGTRCNTSPDYLRFCFAYHTPTEIDRAIELLALAWQEYTAKPNHP